VLPGLALENLGGASGGTPAELGSALATAFTARVAETVARSELEGYLSEKIDESLSGVGDAAKGALRSILGTSDD
jgi:hypothetical protein